MCKNNQPKEQTHYARERQRERERERERENGPQCGFTTICFAPSDSIIVSS